MPNRVRIESPVRAAIDDTTHRTVTHAEINQAAAELNHARHMQVVERKTTTTVTITVIRRR